MLPVPSTAARDVRLGAASARCTVSARHGSYDDPRPTLEEPFVAKFTVADEPPAYRPDLDPCWLWSAGHFSNGYGLIRSDGLQRARAPHLISFRCSTPVKNIFTHQKSHACQIIRFVEINLLIFPVDQTIPTCNPCFISHNIPYIKELATDRSYLYRYIQYSDILIFQNFVNTSTVVPCCTMAAGQLVGRPCSIRLLHNSGNPCRPMASTIFWSYTCNCLR